MITNYLIHSKELTIDVREVAYISRQNGDTILILKGNDLTIQIGGVNDIFEAVTRVMLALAKARPLEPSDPSR